MPSPGFLGKLVKLILEGFMVTAVSPSNLSRFRLTLLVRETPSIKLGSSFFT